jgi:hypothetical protein
MSSEQPASISRWRPRISLLSSLQLLTIAGMAIVIAQLWREVGPLRADNRRLRDEVGELSIEDHDKVHAIEVRTKESLVWKFRVWVPEEKTVGVKEQWGDVPRTGLPEKKGATILAPGEQWIIYRVEKSATGDEWGAVLETAGSGHGSIIPEKDRYWLWPEPAALWGEGVQETTVAAGDDDRSLVLKRWRIADTDDSDDFKKMETTSGFIIWLEW